MKEIGQALKEAITKQLGRSDSEGFKKRLRKTLQDDAPLGMKHRRMDDLIPKTGLCEEELGQRFTPEVMHYTVLSLVTGSGRANEWASRQEVRKMRDLLDLPITGIHYHNAPRKKFPKPPKGG